MDSTKYQIGENMNIQLTHIIGWITANLDKIANIAAWLISGSSILVYFLPWLPENHVFKGVLKVLGKIALNRTSPKP